MEGFSRRGLLASAIAGIAAVPALSVPTRHRGFGHPPFRGFAKPTLRIAHLTDVHLKPEGEAIDRFTACLKAVNSLHHKPDVIFQGGDIILDALSEDHKRVEAQYDLVAGLLEKNTDIPMEHCIGNHDIWGWGHDKVTILESEPLFGKNWWKQWTGNEKTYRSFDAGGWHFVFLDSMMRVDRGVYKAQLDAEQFEWLEGDLAKTTSTTPVCIVSHVPMLSACSALFGKYESEGFWKIPGALMHIDARKIKDLFVKHPNVRLCLSGHTHLLNKVEYNGVTHYCGGAVCGAWWQGPMQETKQGFSLVDLYADGHFQAHYHPY
jgi:Icc protein